MVAALKKLCILRGVCVGTKGLFFDSNFTGLPNAKFFFRHRTLGKLSNYAFSSFSMDFLRGLSSARFYF